MRSDEPLISVIVPACNGQDYLENCIHAVENQTYGNLEVIIVNNGSTDETAAICERLKSEYDNIYVLTLDDAGVSAARNRGIEAAQGSFIAFVDADDRICVDMLQMLYQCILDTGSDVAGCSFFTWSSEEEWKQDAAVGTAPGERAAGQTYVYNADKYLREALLCGNSRCWSKLYRREIFDKVRFSEELTIGEDMLFLIRMLPYVNKIAETDYAGYGYYRNPAGAMNGEFTPRYMDQITCWQLAREEILRIDVNLDSQVTALTMMGIMLTAGKLAVLPAEQRRVYKEYVRVCHEKLKETMQVSGAFGRLSAGYRMKVRMFLLCPSLYINLYHLLKRVL